MLYFASANEVGAALAAYSWQAADDFWRGDDPVAARGRCAAAAGGDMGARWSLAVHGGEVS